MGMRNICGTFWDKGTGAISCVGKGVKGQATKTNVEKTALTVTAFTLGLLVQLGLMLGIIAGVVLGFPILVKVMFLSDVLLFGLGIVVTAISVAYKVFKSIDLKHFSLKSKGGKKLPSNVEYNHVC